MRSSVTISNTDSRSWTQHISTMVTAQPSVNLAASCRRTTAAAVTQAISNRQSPTVGIPNRRNRMRGNGGPAISPTLNTTSPGANSSMPKRGQRQPKNSTPKTTTRALSIGADASNTAASWEVLTGGTGGGAKACTTPSTIATASTP